MVDDNIDLDIQVDPSPWLLNGIGRNDSPVKCKYLTYSIDDKKFVLSCLENCESRDQIQIGLLQLKSKFLKKFDGIDVNKVMDWRSQLINRDNAKRRGPRINLEFENDVTSRLLLCQWREHIDLTLDDPVVNRTPAVLINVAYSYSIIRQAAIETKQEQKWIENQGIQELLCSKK